MIKDFQALGLNKQFIISFITSIVEKNFQPQQYIEQFNNEPKEVHFLVERIFLTRSEKSSSTWSLPLKSWVGWREMIEGTKYSNSILSLRKSKIFSIPSPVLFDLKKKFKDDFSALDKWIAEQFVYQWSANISRKIFRYNFGVFDCRQIRMERSFMI